jgi:hypothetical protein
LGKDENAACSGNPAGLENRSAEAAMGAISCCLVLLAFGLSASHFPGSPRKRFYILAHEIKAGDSADSVKAELNGYESWTTYETQRDYHYLSFHFTASLGTTDSVAVRYNPKTQKVLDVDYSPD